MSELNNPSRGITRIEDVVVSRIAGLAAREVSGVHALGGSGTRAPQGVHVEVGDRTAVVDVSIVAEYGVAIHDLAEAIRENIISAVERMTGLEVPEVNVTVHDVHLDLPGVDDEHH